MPTALKSGSLNLLEPSGPVKACNGIALSSLNEINTTSRIFLASELIKRFCNYKDPEGSLPAHKSSLPDKILSQENTVHIHMFLQNTDICFLKFLVNSVSGNQTSCI